LSIPLIAAHPIKPNMATAWITAVGFAGWYWAGFMTVIYIYYAG
jgi:hypothetical protein